MTRSILVGEVRTGRRITQIPVSDASWSCVHRGTGSITVDIPLGAEEFRVLERSWVGGLYFGTGVVVSPTTVPEAATPVWRPGDGLRPELLSALEPVRCFLAVLEDDVVLEWGIIWSWDYDYSVLRVGAKSMPSLLSRRFVMGNVSSAYASWAVTYTGMSLGTIMKRLVQLTESIEAGELPIVLPADESAAADEDHTRTYRGSDLATVWDRIDDLMGVINGPDVGFEPRLTADRQGIELVMRVGTEADPLLHQAGDDHVWDTRVPRSGVSSLSVQRDASQMSARSWVTGSGTDEALLMSRATSTTLTNVGFPLTEISEARSSVEIQTTLDRWASGNLSANARPWQTWTCTVRADQSPKLGSYRCGDYARIWVPADHPLLGLLLPEGFHRTRIVGISGDMGDDVKLTLAPTIEIR